MNKNKSLRRFGLTAQKLARIELCYDIAGDFPDGAWWAFCEEQDLYPDDFIAYWDWKKANNTVNMER